MASNSNNSNSASPPTSTSTPSTPPVTASSSGKRSRDPADDEVYLDNLYSHKRYLSEMMASSLNGLTVGDTLDNYMDSPARSESMFYFRDDMSSQYSPMSEDSDDSRFCEIPINACSSQSDSLPTSPVSPYRCQRPFGGPSSATPAASSPSYSHNLVAPTSSSQTRQRGSDSEGRFPSSPSDICHSADLRRAALLRSVQMRTQPAPNCPYESPFAPGHEAVPNMESEDVKSLSDEKDYQIGECPSSGASSSHFNEEKTCGSLNSIIGRVESGI